MEYFPNEHGFSSGAHSAEPQQESGIHSALPFARDAAVDDAERELPPLEVRPSVPHYHLPQWSHMQVDELIKCAWATYTHGLMPGRDRSM